MSDGLKPGDIVMVVKPSACCGSAHSLGKVHTVIGQPRHPIGRCQKCGVFAPTDGMVMLDNGMVYGPPRLKKIDPPAEGDSLPTRRELEAV